MWMIELAKQVGITEADADLPTGVIVGSAVIEKVIPPDPSTGEAGLFRWELVDARRIKTPCKLKGHPQPVCFEPF